MSFLKKVGHKVASEAKSQVKSEVSEAIDREVVNAKDRLQGKLDKWEENLYKKVTKMDKHITGKIIKDFNTFKSEWSKVAGDPIQSVLFFAIACYNYCLIDKNIGENMATVILASTFLLKNTSSPTGFKVNRAGDGYLLEHMRESPRIIQSYFGGSPENNYTVDPEKLDMHVVGKYEGKTQQGIPEACITLNSGGKDFDTPLFLRKNNQGQWKMFGFSSLATGVQVTKEELGNF